MRTKRPYTNQNREAGKASRPIHVQGYQSSYLIESNSIACDFRVVRSGIHANCPYANENRDTGKCISVYLPALKFVLLPDRIELRAFVTSVRWGQGYTPTKTETQVNASCPIYLQGNQSISLPDRIELRALWFPRGEVRDERQVRDLHTRPTELKDDHENAEIAKLRPLVSLFAAQTGVEDEREA